MRRTVVVPVILAALTVVIGFLLLVVSLLPRAYDAPVHGVALWREGELLGGRGRGAMPMGDYWYELCRTVHGDVLEKWCRTLDLEGLAYVRHNRAIIVWMPHVNRACEVLGRNVMKEWVFVLRSETPQAEREFVSVLAHAGIDWQVIDGELCVRRRDRTNAMDLLGTGVTSDAYMAMGLTDFAEQWGLCRGRMEHLLNEAHLTYFIYRRSGTGARPLSDVYVRAEGGPDFHRMQSTLRELCEGAARGN